MFSLRGTEMHEIAHRWVPKSAIPPIGGLWESSHGSGQCFTINKVPTNYTALVHKSFYFFAIAVFKIPGKTFFTDKSKAVRRCCKL